MTAADLLVQIMRDSERGNDVMQSRWTYAERKVNQGRAARLVYDIRCEDIPGGPQGLTGISSEEIAAYVCELHNELLNRLVIV